jgi:hypothetical protein
MAMSKLKKFSIITLLVFLALGGGAAWFSYSGYYSKGSRTGKVIKLSEKGIIFKTQEGQLNVEGISTNPSMPGGGVTSIWEFSVDRGRDDIIQMIEGAMRENKRVSLHYEEKYFQFSWRGDTKYFVTKVEILN